MMGPDFCFKKTPEALMKQAHTRFLRVTDFATAVLYMHHILLCGMRPPWSEYDLAEALPAEKLLSRCARPSFLEWKGRPDRKGP